MEENPYRSPRESGYRPPAQPWLTLPRINGDYEASYFDWDLNGTFNVTNNVGIQVGWRKLSNFLRIENDLGDLKFQGMWFGAAIRY